MAGDLGSGQTTSFSNLSVGGTDANGNRFGNIEAASLISAPTISGLPSQVSSSRGTFATVWATSQVTTPQLSAVSVIVPGGIQASGVTFDMRTNSVIPSSVTYAGGASISGLTIGQWGFVFNASGFSIAYSSGKTAYFFGGSTLSAAIT